MASSITLDGQLTDWTNVDRLDFGRNDLDGSKIYGRFSDGKYHFAIESSTAVIGDKSTMWLNTDGNTGTGHSFWGATIGADYKIEFTDSGGGVQPALYSLATDGTPTLVANGVTSARSADGKFIELAIDKAAIGNSTAISTLIDLNDAVYLPTYVTLPPFTLTDQPLPVRTDTNLKVGIVFSESTAKNYFGGTDAGATAYSQLIMAAQSQAIAAGVPFDILTEADLTNLSKVVNYDALIFPYFANVDKAKLGAIESVLKDAVNKYGISLVAAGNFMTNDESNVAFADTYARMESLLGVKRVGGTQVDSVTVTGAGGESSNIIGYGAEDIRTYSKLGNLQVGTAYFEGVNDATTKTLANQTASDGTHKAILATQTGGNNVFFATEAMLADSNMLQHAIGWTARTDNTPELKLQMGRQASLFASRNDMDQSQEIENVQGGIYTKMLSIVEKWKADFNFVGSYYVNIGNDPANGQETNWNISKPVYQSLLAQGNEIGTHSYTHPADTNLLTDAQIKYEFEDSKKILESQLGIKIEGAAVPGAPETLKTSNLIGQYFSYMSGGYTGVGAGYPSAFGYITPESKSVYLAPNIKFDFSLIDAAPEFGGGYTAEQAQQEWVREFNEISRSADLPVFVWPWHDYGPTLWEVNDGQPSRYTEAMYTEFLRYAYEKDTEFVTMLDLSQRIKAFEQAGFNYSFDSASSTMTASVTTNAAVNSLGTFALDVEKGQTIANVSGWYAYDNDSVFLDADGGTFTIKLGTPEDVTHITALPSRAKLLDVTGDGKNLNFSLEGEGKVVIDLADPTGRQVKVTGLNAAGGDTVKQTGDKLELTFVKNEKHIVAVTFDELLAPIVSLQQDTGTSANDLTTNNGSLQIDGKAAGATVEYSTDGTTWTASFTPVEGSNTVQVRQKIGDTLISQTRSFTFTLDTAKPTASVTMSAIGSTGLSLVALAFTEVPQGFNPDSDLSVLGGTLSGLTTDSSGKVFTGTFTPFANYQGVGSVIIKESAYADLAGNNGDGAAAAIQVDTRDPNAGGGTDTQSPSVTVALQAMAANGDVQAVLSFSEEIDPSTFSAQDVSVGGAVLKSLTTSDNIHYTAVLSPLKSAGSKISISVNDKSYADLSGNAGSGATQTFDYSTPKATKGADWLVGNARGNVLNGGDGNDIIRGGKGNDTITGSKGKDLLDLSDGTKGIKITLSQQDTKYASFDGRSAGLGTDKYRDMEGVIGTKFADKITGSSASDILAGLGGNDILKGGSGNDVFVFEPKGGRDTILDFEDNGKRHDKLDVQAFDFDVSSASFAAWKADHVKQQGSHTLVSLDANTSVKLTDIKAKVIGFDDFLF